MKKNIRAMLIALGLSITSLSVTGCGQEDNSNLITYTDALSDVASNTTVDDILNSSNYQELLKNVDLVEKALKLSEKLNELDLSSVVEDSHCDFLSFDDFSFYLDMFNQLYRDAEGKENRVLTSCLPYIKAHEKYINEFIYSYGYQYLTKAAIIEVQCKVNEGLDGDIDQYLNVSIDSSKRVNYNLEGMNKDYGIGTIPSNSLEDLVSHILSCKEEEEKKDESTKSEYNASRNKNLNRLLVSMKEVLYKDYIQAGTFILDNGEGMEVPISRK